MVLRLEIISVIGGCIFIAVSNWFDFKCYKMCSKLCTSVGNVDAKLKEQSCDPFDIDLVILSLGHLYNQLQ